MKTSRKPEYRCCDKCEWHECPNMPKLSSLPSQEDSIRAFLKSIRTQCQNFRHTTGLDDKAIDIMIEHLRDECQYKREIE